MASKKYEFKATYKEKLTDKCTKFITLNEYIKAERSKGIWAASIKKREDGAIIEQCKKLKPYDGKYPVDITFTWHTGTKKDSDNIAFAQKFVLDGMVKGGIIKNDSPKYVSDLHHHIKRQQIGSDESVIVELKEHET